MSTRLRSRLRDLRWAYAPRPAADVSDGELVTRFARARDEEAFAELVRRHGPMVLATCRRVLHPDTHTADDAFQAAFLVLATKAAAVRPPGRVGAWLHGVAVRVARKARAWVRRVAPSAPSDLDRIPAAAAGPDPDAADLRLAIDDVLAGLPARYRAAVVLCDLEGASRAEAAGALGWSEGTLSGRLARARKLLADRLARRGFALPAAGLAVAAVPAHLTAATLKAVALVAAGEVVPGPVAALARGGYPSLTPAFKVLAAGVAGVGLGLGGFGLSELFDPETVAAPPAPTPLAPAFVPAPVAADEKPVPREWRPAHTWTFPHPITTVAVGADIVVGGDKEGTLALFDLKAGKEREKLRQGTDGGEAPGIERVQLSPDGKFIDMTFESGGFHRTTVERKGRDYHGRAGDDKLKPLGVTADGAYWLLLPEKDDELHVVKNTLGVKPPDLRPETRFKHDTRVAFAAGATDEAIATVTSPRGFPVLRFWSKGRDKPVWEVKLWDVENIDVTGVAVSPGGGLVAVTGDAGAVWVFDAKTGKRVATADALTGPVNDVTFSPDGKRVAVACADKIARVVDAGTGKELAVLKGHTKAVTAVAFGPGGGVLATGSADKTVRVYELK